MSQTVFNSVSHDGSGYPPILGCTNISAVTLRFLITPNDGYHARLAMPELIEKTISCPYCGEAISILIDDSFAEQHYIEDCQVCCRPIVLDVLTDADGDVAVQARSEID